MPPAIEMSEPRQRFNQMTPTQQKMNLAVGKKIGPSFAKTYWIGNRGNLTTVQKKRWSLLIVDWMKKWEKERDKKNAAK